MSKTLKKWNKENITQLLLTKDQMVYKSLIELYKKQTGDEQRTESTNHHNNQGFTSGDAKKMTGIAKWALDKKFLTPKQTALVRKRILKYASQLARIANEREEQKVLQGV